METYEKKYKNALEWARQVMNGETGFIRKEVEEIFPELKESEDERIKKELIYFVKSRLTGFYDCKRFTDWLEKQGEQKAILNVPSREVILSIWDLGNEWKELTNGCISTEHGTQLDYIQKHWCESEYYLREKQGEQKPFDYEHATIQQKDFAPKQASPVLSNSSNIGKDEQKPSWSEENEVRINRIVACLENLNVADNDILLKDVDWLKSLKDRVQPKQEWSEEDEKMLNQIIKDYERGNESWLKGQGSLPFGNRITWLKSLKDRLS